MLGLRSQEILAFNFAGGRKFTTAGQSVLLPLPNRGRAQAVAFLHADGHMLHMILLQCLFELNLEKRGGSRPQKKIVAIYKTCYLLSLCKGSVGGSWLSGRPNQLISRKFPPPRHPLV